MGNQQGIGAAWEEHFLTMLNMIRPRVFWIRNYPAAKWVNGKYKVTGVAVPDYTLVWQGVPMLVDLKTTDNKAKYRPYKDQHHQFYKMAQADQSGVIAGYIVEWRRPDGIGFYRVREEDKPSEFVMEPKNLYYSQSKVSALLWSMFGLY